MTQLRRGIVSIVVGVAECAGDDGSAERFEALQACTCDMDVSCGAECGPSVCSGAMPDEACFTCLDARCAAETAACFGS